MQPKTPRPDPNPSGGTSSMLPIHLPVFLWCVFYAAERTYEEHVPRPERHTTVKQGNVAEACLRCLMKHVRFRASSLHTKQHNTTQHNTTRRNTNTNQTHFKTKQNKTITNNTIHNTTQNSTTQHTITQHTFFFTFSLYFISLHFLPTFFSYIVFKHINSVLKYNV
jgi:hypothetical protein